MGFFIFFCFFFGNFYSYAASFHQSVTSDSHVDGLSFDQDFHYAAGFRHLLKSPLGVDLDVRGLLEERSSTAYGGFVASQESGAVSLVAGYFYEMFRPDMELFISLGDQNEWIHQTAVMFKALYIFNLGHNWESVDDTLSADFEQAIRLTIWPGWVNWSVTSPHNTSSFVVTDNGVDTARLLNLQQTFFQLGVGFDIVESLSLDVDYMRFFYSQTKSQFVDYLQIPSSFLSYRLNWPVTISGFPEYVQVNDVAFHFSESFDLHLKYIAFKDRANANSSDIILIQPKGRWDYNESLKVSWDVMWALKYAAKNSGVDVNVSYFF